MYHRNSTFRSASVRCCILRESSVRSSNVANRPAGIPSECQVLLRAAPTWITDDVPGCHQSVYRRRAVTTPAGCARTPDTLDLTRPLRDGIAGIIPHPVLLASRCAPGLVLIRQSRGPSEVLMVSGWERRLLGSVEHDADLWRLQAIEHLAGTPRQRRGDDACSCDDE